MKEYHFDSIDSTSSYLKKNYDKYEDMTFVSSDFQSKGHGRYSRVWYSNKGENLLFSILIKDKELIDKYASLSLSCATVIYQTLKDLNIKNIKIKWPNDVYVNDKKICGILLESISFSNKIEALVLGVGINVNSLSFDENLINQVTSIKIEISKNICINEFKEKIYSCFIDMFSKLKNNDNSYLDVIRNNNYLKGKFVYASIKNEKRLVEVIDINDDNSLKVKIGEEVHNLYSSEVTFEL